MARRSIVTVGIAMVLAAVPLRAATGPHAGTDSQNTAIWTSDDLERIRSFGQLSIVGRINDEGPAQSSLPRAYTNFEEAEWYSAEAARLQGELERRHAELQSYQQALEDARSLRKTTAGINLEKGHVGLSPESAIELLRERVNQAQAQLDALQDQARHNDVPPGTLRDQ